MGGDDGTDNGTDGQRTDSGEGTDGVADRHKTDDDGADDLRDGLTENDDDPLSGQAVSDSGVPGTAF